MFRYFIYVLLGVLTCFSCNNTVKPNKNTDKTELRIISLAASISDELVELGMKKNIVGATSYCKVSKENKELIVGDALEINEEKILLLKPDIVIYTSLTKQSTIEILKKNGIKTFMYGKANSFDAICNNYLKLGEMVGKKALAKQIVENARKKIDSLKSIIPKLTKLPTIFFQLGANPIATVIPDTYMDEFIKFSGGKNIFYDIDKYIVSTESVLLRNPDYIFITSMGIIGSKEKENWEKYKDISAAKENRIFIIDSSIASSPTVTNFVKTVELMVKKMYF